MNWENWMRPAARLITVAAAYERLTSVGEDGTPIAPDEALRRLEAGASKIYDPAVVQLLATAVGVYPVGSASRNDRWELRCGH